MSQKIVKLLVMIVADFLRFALNVDLSKELELMDLNVYPNFSRTYFHSNGLIFYYDKRSWGCLFSFVCIYNEYI